MGWWVQGPDLPLFASHVVCSTCVPRRLRESESERETERERESERKEREPEEKPRSMQYGGHGVVGLVGDGGERVRESERASRPSTNSCCGRWGGRAVC